MGWMRLSNVEKRKFDRGERTCGWERTEDMSITGDRGRGHEDRE